MLSIGLVLSAIAMFMVSGLFGYVFSPRASVGQRLTTFSMLSGSIVGWSGIALAGTHMPPSLSVHWFLPWGAFSIALDPLSCLFLGLVFVVPTLGSIYGLGYWKQSSHMENGRRLGLFYGVLAGSMGLVCIARDSVLFLIAWEVMAVAAYFAATAEEDNPEVRRAGWVYLVATHLGTLCLLAMFALWRHVTGSFALESLPAMPVKMAGTVFVLALIGFGFKAGFMPLHVWLPGAHANAPSHVSAVMSGVMLKMGIYGLLRMTALFPTPALWWGGVLLGVGAVTGLLGIAFAISQYDLKRVLAYSSIENIGIIAMGMGLALCGRSLGRWDWVLLGLSGTLLHVWNHGLFKSLLFFGAGAVIHSTHTRNLDQLGGLAKRMPRVTVFFLIGAVAICGLPPVNGFVSEWLLYLGFMQILQPGKGPGMEAAASAAVVLAMIGALAVVCFVKLFGTVFLGLPRSAEPHAAHDPSLSMRLPMAFLASVCVVLGILPLLVFPFVESAVRTWALPFTLTASLREQADLFWITGFGIAVIVLAGGLYALLSVGFRKYPKDRIKTWDCGYAQPSNRMQYTGSSFSQVAVSLFAMFLKPQQHTPSLRQLFPGKGQFKTLVSDTVLDRWVLPFFNLAGRIVPRVRVLQQGQLHWYLLYVLVITLLLLFFGGIQ